MDDATKKILALLERTPTDEWHTLPLTPAQWAAVWRESGR